MSIAWGSLVLLVVLLPGVLFFVGQFLPEKFTRETAERSALGQLAGTLLVSFAIHGALYCVLWLGCGGWLPCIDLKRFLAALTLERSDPVAIAAVASNIHEFRWWVLAYVLLSASIGTALGYVTGKGVISGKLRFLAQHHWVYSLSVDDKYTVAYVMTHVQHEERVLMYRGFLKSFHLQRDGRFSYLVLTDVRRFYMQLGPEFAVTSHKDAWRQIGETTRAGEKEELNQSREHRRWDETYFVIEGEDIANVVFDRYAVAFPTSITDQLFNEAIQRALAKYHQAIGEELRDVLAKPPFSSGEHQQHSAVDRDETMERR
jgi:hypothetical protein